MTTDDITNPEVQQIRQKAIFHGEVTRDQVKRLAQSWLEQDHRIDELRGQVGIEVREREQWETNAERAETAIDRVRAIHQPIDAIHEQTGQTRHVCTGCGTDAGNWQPWPCPTIRGIDSAAALAEASDPR